MTLPLQHSSARTPRRSIAPNLQLDYRWRQNMQFHLEGGVSHTVLGQGALPNVNFDEYYAITGYRLDF